MKLREITQAQRDRYLGEARAVTQDYAAMINAIDEDLKKYGQIHAQQKQEILTLGYAKEKKDELRANLKSINASTVDGIITKLTEIKDRYIREVAPVQSTTDQLELSFIEKELRVMTDTEFLKYYKENYLDENIVRLCNIENKARRRLEGGGGYLSLPRYSVEDSVTSKLDELINHTAAMKQFVNMACVFAGSISETGKVVPKVIYWDTLLGQLEKQNVQQNAAVGLMDLIK